MKQRSVIFGIIFSLITCGIYSIIWLWVLNNDLRAYNNKKLNSGINFLLCIITCGLWGFIWQYNIGREIEDAGGPNYGILYVILFFFSFGIISTALMQLEVNRICEQQNVK